MYSKFTLVLAVIAFTLAACDKNSGGGRPAPNSVPAAQPPVQGAPPPPANDPNAPNAPSKPEGKDQSTPENKDQKPTPSKDQEHVHNTKVYIYDNHGEILGTKILDKTFHVANFDNGRMPEEFRTVTARQNGKDIRVAGLELTHLSDESYISCSNPACIDMIAGISEYAHHAQTCWFPSISTEITSRLEFHFSKTGRLDFKATTNRGSEEQNIYLAKNIEYNLDSEGRLLISPFLATTIENDVKLALSVSGLSSKPENGNAIPLRQGTVYGKPGFNLKATMVVEFGELVESEFTPAAPGRFYVGGTIAGLRSIPTKKVVATKGSKDSKDPKEQKSTISQKAKDSSDSKESEE